MLKSFVDRFRLGRVERKLKRLRVRQRKTRRDLKDLERRHDDGEISTDTFEAETEKLEEKKRDITRKIKAVRERRDTLEEALDEE